MKNVYLLTHGYETRIETKSGDDFIVDHEKFIGVFSTKEKAESALEKYQKLPGFRSWPEGFLIVEWDLDNPSWPEGFSYGDH